MSYCSRRSLLQAAGALLGSAVSTRLFGDTTIFHIEDWFGVRQARPTIPVRSSNKPTLVIADDLDLVNRSYALSRREIPKRILFVANTLRLTDIAHFDLSGENVGLPESRSGGYLFIFARELICDNKGFLSFKSWAQPAKRNAVTGPTPDGVLPVGGSLVICFEKLTLSSSRREAVLQSLMQQPGKVIPEHLLPAKVDAPLQASDLEKLSLLIRSAYPEPGVRDAILATVTMKSRFDDPLIDLVLAAEREVAGRFIDSRPTEIFRSFMGSADLEDTEFYLRSPWGRPDPGMFNVVDSVTELVSKDATAKVALSEWITRWYRSMNTRALDYSLKNKRASLFEVFREVGEFPSYALESSYEDEFQKQVKGLLDLRSKSVLPLYPRSFQVIRPDGIPITAETFAESASIENRGAPTSALVTTIVVGDRTVLGFVKLDQSHPDEIAIYFSAELSVDPFVAQQLRQSLEQRGERYAGLFTNWELVAKPFAVEGIVAERSSIVAAGTSIQCKITLKQHGVYALALFSSSQGLPVTFDWNYAPVPDVRGNLRGISLSRARRSNPNVEWRQGRIWNHETSAVTVRYVSGANQQLFPFDAVVIQPGASTSPGLPVGIDLTRISVPPEAVECNVADPTGFSDSFVILNDQQLTEEITVLNELGDADPLSGAAMDYVDFKIAYEAVGEEGMNQVWSDIVLPPPASGSKKSRWFIKTRQARAIRVQGRAHYVGGGYRDLLGRVENGDVVRLGRDMLPDPQRRQR